MKERELREFILSAHDDDDDDDDDLSNTCSTRGIFQQSNVGFWIQSFSSPTLVAKPRLKSQVCPNIERKHKELCWELELWLLCPILKMITFTLYLISWGCLRGVMVKVMDCGIVVREFVLQSRHYVYFWANTLGKGMNPLILPAMG